jgi:hypothetical protein
MSYPPPTPTESLENADGSREGARLVCKRHRYRYISAASNGSMLHTEGSSYTCTVLHELRISKASLQEAHCQKPSDQSGLAIIRPHACDDLRSIDYNVSSHSPSIELNRETPRSRGKSLLLGKSFSFYFLLHSLDLGRNDSLVHFLMVPHLNNLVRLHIIMVLSQPVVLHRETKRETEKRSDKCRKHQRLESLAIGLSDQLAFSNSSGDCNVAEDLCAVSRIVHVAEVVF